MKQAAVCILWLWTGLAALASAQSVTVAVTPFKGPVAEEAVTLSNLFGSKLSRIQGVTVLTRTALEDVLEEADFQNSGFTDEETAVRIGSFTNASYIVTGRITTLGEVNLLYVQILGVDGSVVSGSEVRFRRIEDVLDKLDALVEEAAAQMTGENYRTRRRETDYARLEESQRLRRKGSFGGGLIVTGVSLTMIGTIGALVSGGLLLDMEEPSKGSSRYNSSYFGFDKEAYEADAEEYRNTQTALGISAGVLGAGVLTWITGAVVRARAEDEAGLLEKKYALAFTPRIVPALSGAFGGGMTVSLQY